MCARERERQAAHRVRNEQALDGMLHEELHDVVVPKVARYVKWDRADIILQHRVGSIREQHFDQLATSSITAPCDVPCSKVQQPLPSSMMRVYARHVDDHVQYLVGQPSLFHPVDCGFQEKRKILLHRIRAYIEQHLRVVFTIPHHRINHRCKFPLHFLVLSRALATCGCSMERMRRPPLPQLLVCLRTPFLGIKP